MQAIDSLETDDKPGNEELYTVWVGVVATASTGVLQNEDRGAKARNCFVLLFSRGCTFGEEDFLHCNSFEAHVEHQLTRRPTLLTLERLELEDSSAFFPECQEAETAGQLVCKLFCCGV